MNTSTNLKLAALALCLLVLFADAAASHALAQSKSKEKSDATAAAQGAGTPSDVVRAYYTALREGRVRDAMLMSVLRPAVEELSAADLAEYQPDFERIKQLAP